MNMAYTGGCLPRRGRGFTMIEMSIVITLAGVLLMILYQQTDRMSRNTYGATTGQYMAAMAVGLGKYLDIYYDVLGNVTSPSQVAANAITGRVPQYSRVAPRIIAPADQNQDSDVARSSWLSSGTLPTASTTYSAWSDAATKAVCADQMCAEITVADLIAANVVSPDFPATAPNGMRFSIRIRRNASILPASDCNSSRIDAVIVADGPAMGPNGEGVDTDGIQIGDAETMAGMAQAMENHGVHPLMFARPVVNGDLTAIGAITPAVPAAITPANGEMSFFGASDQIHNTLGPFVRAGVYGLDPAAIKEGTPLVRISDWHGNPDGAYFRTDGTCPMRGDTDMGGHSIKNLKQVTLDAPCDGIDATSAASKAMSGQLATFTAVNADPAKPAEKLGSGFLLVCGYDQVKGGYIWKKATAGITGVDEAMAGMIDGYETGEDYVCWGWAGNPTWLFDHGVSRVKFVMWGGKVQALKYHEYDAVAATGGIGWYLENGGPTGYDLNVDYSRSNNSYNTSSHGYNWWIGTDASGVPWCIQGKYGPLNSLGDPNSEVWGDWYFGPNGIVFQSNIYAAFRPPQSTTGTLGGIPVQGNVSVSGANCTQTCTTDALGVTSCSGWSCSPNGGSATLNGLTQSTTDDANTRIVTYQPFKQTSVWTFQRRTSLNIAGCLGGTTATPIRCH